MDDMRDLYSEKTGKNDNWMKSLGTKPQNTAMNNSPITI